MSAQRPTTEDVAYARWLRVARRKLGLPVGHAAESPWYWRRDRIKFRVAWRRQQRRDV